MNFRYVSWHMLAYMVVMFGFLGVSFLVKKSEYTAYWLSTLFVMYQMCTGERKDLTIKNSAAIAMAGVVLSLSSVWLCHQYPTLFQDAFAGPKGVLGGWVAGVGIYAVTGQGKQFPEKDPSGHETGGHETGTGPIKSESD